RVGPRLRLRGSRTQRPCDAGHAVSHRVHHQDVHGDGVMQLRDEGRLQLDDPVSKHLSWFRVRPREAGGHPITIRHLLTHVSGLPREADFPYWTTDEFPTREEIIKALPDYEQTFSAETRWKYSNLAVVVAGEVVAAVSGEPWDRYVKAHILEP